MTKRIYIVDDHPVVRKGLAFLLSDEPDLKMCGEASTAQEALEEIPEKEPDLVVVDLSLDGMGGLELIKRITTRWPDVHTLVVSAHDESLYAERALIAGAKGYLEKSEVDLKIIEAIRRIFRGGFFVSEEINSRIMQQYRRDHVTPEKGQSVVDRLTDRELEVFELLGRGMSTADIGEALNVSPKTVESHRGRIKNKLNVDTTTKLLQRATLWVERQK